MRLTQGQKLIDRIKRQELQARDLVDALARNFLKGNVNHAIGSGITIMHRISKQRIALANQAKVNAPGINTNTIQTTTTCGSLPDRNLDFIKEAWQVPVERIEHLNGTVGEAVSFFKGKVLAIKTAQETSTAFRSQVECKVIARHSHRPYFSGHRQANDLMTPMSKTVAHSVFRLASLW